MTSSCYAVLTIRCEPDFVTTDTSYVGLLYQMPITCAREWEREEKAEEKKYCLRNYCMS